jgi:hypothetical protein
MSVDVGAADDLTWGNRGIASLIRGKAPFYKENQKQLVFHSAQLDCLHQPLSDVANPIAGPLRIRAE